MSVSQMHVLWRGMVGEGLPSCCGVPYPGDVVYNLSSSKTTAEDAAGASQHSATSTEVLTPVVVPVFAGQCQMVYQHDNTWPHMALATQAFLAQHNITTMDWPALSPDLNPIEHLWDEIQHMINQRPAPVVTQQQLCQAVVDTYNNVPRAFIRNLFLSMGRMCAAVMASNGGHTRY